MPEVSTTAAQSGSTLAEVLLDARRQLQRAGIEDAGRDVRLLASGVLGVSDVAQITQPDAKLTPQAHEQLSAAIARRAAREPVSRILGRRPFYGRDFLITPATLDPRPDTECIIELTLDLVEERGWRGRPLRILDVGTGSGCILLTLLAELPLATGLARDIEPDALAVARTNADRLGLSDRIRFGQGRSLEGLEDSFDILVSNPPYIPSAQIPGLEPEVRSFDPLAALDGGGDGLSVYREIIARLKAVVPKGLAVFEVGAGQAGDVEKLIADLGAGHDIRSRADLGGHVRGVACWTQSSIGRE